MANSLEEIIKKKERLAQTFRDLPAICGEEMLNFTFENFEKEGWQGETFREWPKERIPQNGVKKTTPGENYYKNIKT